MAISSSFASRSVACTATALLLTSVYTSYTSCATPGPPSSCGLWGIDAIEMIENPRPHAFLTPQISISMHLGDSSGRADISTTMGLPHSDRTELIQSTLIDNIDPVVLLLGARPEKLHQLTPTALRVAYFRLLCIGNKLPVEITVYDSNVTKIPLSVQDAVSNSSSRLGSLASTLALPQLSIPGHALAMCAEVLGMPFIAPVAPSPSPTLSLAAKYFPRSTSAPPRPATSSRPSISASGTSPSPLEDLRISPFNAIASDDLEDFFSGMTKAQLLVQARLTGANPVPLGASSTNEKIIASIIDQIIDLREAADSDDTPVTPPAAQRQRWRRSTESRSASDNMRFAQMIVDINRLIIATRMVIPSLFSKNVYVSVSSFDTVTMQGIFSFLDTQVALYNYLISRVRAGNSAPDNNLLERRTSGLELILGV